MGSTQVTAKDVPCGVIPGGSGQVGTILARAAWPPRVWLQASTATIYAHRYDAPNDEARTPRTRKVKMRTAMVMSPDPGGVFDTILGLVRRGLGGKAGDGRQYVSWVHHVDFARAVRWLIGREGFDGVVNIAAPNPLPYADFMRALREAWGIPFGLPATQWMLEIGARLLGTETELVLKSRRVIPGRLLQEGFAFELPAWPEAARDLCAAWRRQRA